MPPKSKVLDSLRVGLFTMNAAGGEGGEERERLGAQPDSARTHVYAI